MHACMHAYIKMYTYYGPKCIHMYLFGIPQFKSTQFNLNLNSIQGFVQCHSIFYLNRIYFSQNIYLFIFHQLIIVDNAQQHEAQII
jgi:hypothetical protein